MSRRATTTRFAVLVVAGGLAAGCATTNESNQQGAVRTTVTAKSRAESQPVPGAHSRASRPAPASVAAGIAASQVGTPYRYGGASPAGFDCSGLVHYAYGRAGVSAPRTTGGLWRSLSPISRNRLAVGDVLFFDIKGKVSHVGLYLGDGRFVHAPSSGREVVIASLDDRFYRSAFIRAGRF